MSNYNHYLRDQALQIFLRHFFSVEWIRSKFIEKLILNYQQHNLYFLDLEKKWSDLYYLIRLSLDFYPTTPILWNLLQLAEENNQDTTRDLSIRKLYLTGLVLELLNEYKDNPVIPSLCSEVLKCSPSNQVLFAREIYGLMHALALYDDKNLSVHFFPDKSNIERDANGYLGAIISTKVGLERQKFKDDLFQYLLHLARPYPVYSQAISNFDWRMDQSIDSMKPHIVPYAMNCIEIPGIDWHNISTETILSTARIFIIRKHLKAEISRIRTVAMHTMKNLGSSIMGETLTLLDAFIADVNTLLSTDGIDGSIDEYQSNFQINNLVDLNYWTMLMSSTYQTICEVHGIVLPEDLSSDYKIRFRVYLSACIKSIVNVLNEFMSQTSPRPTLITPKFSSSLLASNQFLKEMLSFQSALTTFETKKTLYPMFFEYLSSWRQRYFDDALDFLESNSGHVGKESQTYSNRLSAQEEQIKSFDFHQILNEFRDILEQTLDKEKEDDDLVQRLLKHIAYPVIFRSHLHSRKTIVEMLHERKESFSILAMKEEIQFAENLQLRLKQIYPELNQEMMHQINWNQQSFLQFFLIDLFDILYVESVSNKKTMQMMKILSFIKDDIHYFYKSNRTISKLLDLNISIRIEFMYTLLKIQFETFTRLFDGIKNVNIEMLTHVPNQKSCLYNFPLANEEYAAYFPIPPHSMRCLTNPSSYGVKVLTIPYEELLLLADINTKKSPFMKPFYDSLVEMTIKLLLLWSKLENKRRTSLMEVFSLILKRFIPCVESGIANSLEFIEEIPNVVQLSRCFGDLLSVAHIGGTKSQRKWEFLFDQLEKALNRLEQRNLLTTFLVEQWPNSFKNLSLLNDTERIIDLLPRHSSKRLIGRILTSLYHIEFAIIWNSNIISNSQWVHQAVQILEAVFDDVPGQEEILQSKRLNGIISILIDILPSLKIDTADLSIVHGLPQKYQETMDYCAGLASYVDNIHFSVDYCYFIVSLIGERLGMFLDYLFSTTSVVAIETRFFHFQCNFLIKAQQRLTVLYGFHQFHQLLEYMTLLSNRPYQVTTITNPYYWHSFFSHKNMISFFLEDSWKYLEYLQQYESFLSFKLVTLSDKEQDRFKAYIILPLGSTYKENKNCVRFVEMGKEYYIKACTLFIEWRSMIEETSPPRSIQEIETTVIELFQQINLLFLCLYYATISVTCPILVSSFEEEKKKMILSRKPRRIFQFR